jgi:hypothetical protein
MPHPDILETQTSYQAKMVLVIASKMLLIELSFIEYVESRDNFSASKKARYIESHQRNKLRQQPWNMKYSGFLKAGEVRISHELTHE